MSDGQYTPAQSGFMVPDAQKSREAHTYTDKDLSPESLHHTLGNLPTQAAPGLHVHWGPWLGLAAAGFVLSANVVADIGGGWGPCKVRRSVNGDEVQLSGLIGATGAWAATYTFMLAPAGYKPPIATTWAIPVAVSGAEQSSRLSVRTDGYFYRNPAAATNDWTSIHGTYSTRAVGT